MKNLFLVISFLFYFVSCTIKETRGPEMPKQTDTGKGIMAFKVNGEIWYTSGGYLFGRNANAKFYSNMLNINGSNSHNAIFFYVNSGFNKGNYTLSKYNYAVYHKDSDNTNFITYSTDTLHMGFINITTLDTIKKIISGTFQFNAKNTNGSDELKITEGQFDVMF